MIKNKKKLKKMLTKQFAKVLLCKGNTNERIQYRKFENSPDTLKKIK